MLQNIRDGAAKWLVWLIIGIVIITMTLWGISYYFMDSGFISAPVAKVNGDKITIDDLHASYNRMRQQQPQLFTNADAQEKIKRNILENLIKQSVLTQAAIKAGFAVSRNQVSSYIATIPAFQMNGQFSQMQFLSILNQLLYTQKQFINDVHDTMLINQVRNGIAASGFVLPNETRRFIALLRQKRDIGYMLIPNNRFTKKINVSARQIKDYYRQHQAQFKTPEKINIKYIEITPEQEKAKLKPTTSQLLSYYENNLANYSTPTRWRVEHILLNIPKDATEKQLAMLKAKLIGIRKQAEGGTDFATLAKKYSEDVVSAYKGGKIPWFTAGSLGPIFEKATAALKRGQISEPVQTRYGFELIKLLAVEKQKVESYKSAASNVRQAYENQQLHRIMADKSDELANLTFENPNTLEPAARQLGVAIKTTPLFTRHSKKVGILANPNVVIAAFSDDVLQQKNNSELITLENNSIVVLRVDQHIDAAIKPLNAVRDNIKNSIQQQQAKQQAASLGNQLLAQIKKGQDPIMVAQHNALTWIKKNNVTRDMKDFNVQILEQAFNLPIPTATQKIVLTGLTLKDGNFAIVGVTNVINAKLTDVPLEQRTLFKQQLEGTVGRSAYNSYIKTQQSNASIKEYPEEMG